MGLGATRILFIAGWMRSIGSFKVIISNDWCGEFYIMLLHVRLLFLILWLVLLRVLCRLYLSLVSTPYIGCCLLLPLLATRFWTLPVLINLLLTLVTVLRLSLILYLIGG